MAANDLLIDDSGALFLGGGDALQISDGAGDDCCCGDCCETPGGPPTAAFSWEAVENDPCTISFTDDSTAGTCGAIVAWQWSAQYLPAGPFTQFSTSQNPTNVDFESPPPTGHGLGQDPYFAVKLIVTDVEGCTDEIIQFVGCSCGCCLPNVEGFFVTFNGFTDDNGCTDCELTNDVFYIPKAASCEQGDLLIDDCYANPDAGFVSAFIQCAVPNELTVEVHLSNGNPFSSNTIFKKTIAVGSEVYYECRDLEGALTLDVTSNSGCAPGTASLVLDVQD